MSLAFQEIREIDPFAAVEKAAAEAAAAAAEK